MKLKIEIDLDNAAFEPDANEEIARILGDLSGMRLYDESPIRIRDNNGNTVGNLRIE